MAESAYPLKGRVLMEGGGGRPEDSAAGFKQLFADESTHTTLIDISHSETNNKAEKMDHIFALSSS